MAAVSPTQAVNAIPLPPVRTRRRALVRFVQRNPLATAGAVVLLLMVLGSVFAAQLSPYNPTAINVRAKLAPPSAAHLFGTDFFGRDLLSRILYGGRNTLAIAALVIAFSFALGVPLGLVSGFVGRWVDTVIMRLVDAWLAFPTLVLAIALAAALGPGLRNAMLAIGITFIPQFARVARGQALSIRSLPYIEAARATGVSQGGMLWRYVLPNSLGPLIVQATLNLGSAILQTASLGFLGLGTQPPLSEWGADVAANTAYLREAPWAAIAPGLAILIAVLACNIVGDAVVDWLNPRLRQR